MSLSDVSIDRTSHPGMFALSLVSLVRHTAETGNLLNICPTERWFLVATASVRSAKMLVLELLEAVHREQLCVSTFLDSYLVDNFH